MARKTEDDPIITKEDKHQDPEAEADIAGMVNKAVTVRLKKFQQLLQAQLEDTLKTHTEALEKQFEERQVVKEPNSADGDEKVFAGRMAKVEARYEKRIQELEARAEKERQEREQERQTRLAQEERQALADELRKRGVPPESVDLGVAYYWTHTKRVGRDETGKLVWLTGDDLEPHKPLTEGVEEALATDLGKRLLPPIPAGGSGARAPSVRSEKGKELSDADLGAIIADSSS